MKLQLRKYIYASLALLTIVALLSTYSPKSTLSASYNPVAYAHSSSQSVTSTGTSVIHTSQSGYDFQPITVSILTTGASGVVTPAIISIGTNSPNYNNIANNIIVGTSVDGITNLLTSSPVSIPPDTDIVMKVGTAAIATTCTVKAALTGYNYPH